MLSTVKFKKDYIMSLCVPILFADIVMFTGCGQVNTASAEHYPIPVYNQVYQENREAEPIREIEAKAKGAYVLMNVLEDDIAAYVSQIKDKGNQVSSYISVGTGEVYGEDFDALQPYLSATAWEDWPDEYMVSDVDGALPIMKKRIEKVASRGADWVEFDNMDWLDEQRRTAYHLSATTAEAKTYVNALCNYAHAKGMQCMAKNTVDGFGQFDGVTYESFRTDKNWWDTQGTRDFLDAGKLVVIVHYSEPDCDGVYAWYKNYYKSDKISFICEDAATEKYRHYNQ